MDESDNNHFQTSLVSLSLIILSFFAYLNTLTSPHPLKEKKAINSVRSEFSPISQIENITNEYQFLKLTNELKIYTDKHHVNLDLSKNYISLTIPTKDMILNDNFTKDGEIIFDRIANIAKHQNLNIKISLQYFTLQNDYASSLTKAFNLTAKLNRRLLFHGLKQEEVTCLTSLTTWEPIFKIEIY